ncbi:hypothetical protein ACE1TH_13660 [Shouchella sp. JSM 1781072]|uniref:hypothetical protein n=1 Tax=Shouchella sp. JSM 1781072 TaxID=3344581 RepID=UPI0035C07CE0
MINPTADSERTTILISILLSTRRIHEEDMAFAALKQSIVSRTLHAIIGTTIWAFSASIFIGSSKGTNHLRGVYI